MIPTIALINDSSVVSDSEAAAIAEALHYQAMHDFAPVSGDAAYVVFVPNGQPPPPGSWHLALLDNADVAAALGYHDLTNEDLPLGKVFCQTTLDDGGIISVTTSHELLEMLGDPQINLCVSVLGEDSKTRIYAYEVSDACESDDLSYDAPNGIKLSDFVLPAYWQPRSPEGTQFDFCRRVSRPLQVLPGGYLGVMNSNFNWTQLTADGKKHKSSTVAYHGNRWHRRGKKASGKPMMLSTRHAKG